MANDSNKVSKKVLVLIPTILLFIYFYPRFLNSTLGEASPWTSYLYMYGFGGVFFGVGMLLITATDSCRLGRGRDSRYFNFLIAGFLFFTTLHGVWIWLSLNMPVKGGM